MNVFFFFLCVCVCVCVWGGGGGGVGEQPYYFEIHGTIIETL